MPEDDTTRIRTSTGHLELAGKQRARLQLASTHPARLLVYNEETGQETATELDPEAVCGLYDRLGDIIRLHNLRARIDAEQEATE